MKRLLQCPKYQKQPIDIDQVDTLFDKFKENMAEVLLFVNSVEEISLVEVLESTSMREEETMKSSRIEQLHVSENVLCLTKLERNGKNFETM